jgi:hypothetical protein
MLSFFRVFILFSILLVMCGIASAQPSASSPAQPGHGPNAEKNEMEQDHKLFSKILKVFEDQNKVLSNKNNLKIAKSADLNCLDALTAAISDAQAVVRATE